MRADPTPRWECTRRGLVTPVRVDPTGVAGPTPKQARGPRWTRTSCGLYVPGDTDRTSPEQRIVEASAVLPPHAAITGWAALRWMGARWFDGTVAGDPAALVDVVLATGGTGNVRAQPGIRPSEERLPRDHVLVVDGIPVTSPAFAVLFEMRYADRLWSAVRAMDLAAQGDVASIAEVLDLAGRLNGWTGIPQAREALPLADENVWSPQEVWLRELWTADCGFPRPLCNQPVFDLEGNHIATPDLLDPIAGVAGEYDGALHLSGDRRARDLRREAALRAVGLEFFAVVAADRRDRAAVTARMREARSRAALLPEDRRQWTLRLPDNWPPTATVAQRRALTASDRAVWLRRGAG